MIKTQIKNLSISLLFSSTLIAGSAFADTCSKGLMPLFTSFQAAKICATFSAGTIGTLANNTFATARDAANSANLDIWKADSSDNTVLNAKTGKVINLDVAVTPEVAISDDKIAFLGNAGVVTAPTSVAVAVGSTPEVTFSNDLQVFSGNAPIISAATSVSIAALTTPEVVISNDKIAMTGATVKILRSDDAGNLELGGGSVDSVANGALIVLRGHTDGSAPDRVAIDTGSGTSGVLLQIRNQSTAGPIDFHVNQGTKKFEMLANGAFVGIPVTVTTAATPAEGTNDLKSYINVIPTAAAADAAVLPSVPVAGEVHIIQNSGPNAVRVKAAGTPGIGAGAAGTYFSLAAFQQAVCVARAVAGPWDCSLGAVATPAGP